MRQPAPETGRLEQGVEEEGKEWKPVIAPVMLNIAHIGGEV